MKVKGLVPHIDIFDSAGVFSMARQLRVEYEGAICHVMSWGVRQETIIWDDEDRDAGRSRASFIKNLPRCRLKLIPSWEERIGCVKNVSEQAFPFQGGTLDIASADGVGFFFQSAHSAASVK
jgi:hypothetical protein